MGLDYAGSVSPTVLRIKGFRFSLFSREEGHNEIRAAWPSTSPVEVTNVSPHGFWMFVGDRELFVPFKDFPWFRDATVREITNVELPSPHHLHWPDLDMISPLNPSNILRSIRW